MVINRIQFQLILPMPAFITVCGTEAQFEKLLEAIRWPYGSDFPPCGRAAHYVLRDGVRKVFQCHACQHQASLITRTVFQCTKLPLTV